MNITWIKKHRGMLTITSIMLVLAIRDRNLFWIGALIFIFGVNAIVTKPISTSLQTALKYSIWIPFTLLLGLIFYVNHNLPHGPAYFTGEIVCQNDDRGPCGPEYKEDLSRVNIPNWAKFCRGSEAWLILMGLAFAGIIINSKNEEGQKQWP